ncbi:MAG: hypothetical protein ABF242_09760 [Flavobacteriales bacterium]
MQRIYWNIVAIFCFLFILTFEFDYSVFPNIFQWINPFFEVLVSVFGSYLFGLEEGFVTEISSDSIGLYIHVFNVLLFSVSIVLFNELFNKDKEVNLRPYLLQMLTYYLSLQLLIYGFDKVFKAQFFLPEPNTLFTPIKDISKDLLYWSTIGVSRSYSLFLGMAELLAAVFLLFRKTRILGIIMGLGIMLNVVAVNFSFDISVKVYGLFLLLCFVILLSPYFTFLHQVFVKKIPAFFPRERELFFTDNLKLKRGIKLVVIVLFLTEGLFPFIATNNFNDDSIPRPKFHGAYEIMNPESEIENLFIHRKGYLIFKNKKDVFQDFQLEIESATDQFLVFDYANKTHSTLNYEEVNNQLVFISGEINGKEISYELQEIDCAKSVLLQPSFHWTTQ